MASKRANSTRLEDSLVLTRCCPEAQADGVPCPTLGRSCEACERAMAVEAEQPDWVIRPTGGD